MPCFMGVRPACSRAGFTWFIFTECSRANCISRSRNSFFSASAGSVRCRPVPARSFGGEPHVGVVLAEQYAVFGTGGEHAVWLVDPFGYEVVDEYAYVGFVASQYKFVAAVAAQVGVDTGYETLAGGLFISGRSVICPAKKRLRTAFVSRV